MTNTKLLAIVAVVTFAFGMYLGHKLCTLESHYRYCTTDFKQLR